MFSRSASFVKTAPEWAARSARHSADAAARRFARENMVAIVMRGDDSAVSYLYDVANDRIAKTTHRNVEWAA